MKRRNFLSLFLLAPASALAEDGLLFDGPEKVSGLLNPVNDMEGMLFDSSSPVVVVVAEKELPEIWYWSHEGCVPCVRFKNDYAANKKDCGFVAAEQKGQRPPWMPDSDPQFWWHVSEKIPTQKDVSNTRHVNGYLSWKDLMARFRSSRESKKTQIKQVGGPTKDPFAQPDQQGIRAVARYHQGHDCPSCGKSQFNIENDAGPSHTHRCRSCSTVWYHADQVRSWLS